MSEVKLVITGDATSAVKAVDAAGAALDKMGTTGAGLVPGVVSPLNKIAPALDAIPARAKKATKEVNEFGISAGQTAMAFRQLPAQLNDVGISLAGGQSPLLVLAQQGSQVVGSFGGIRPAAAALAGYLSPVAVGVGAVATAVGVLALAAYQGRSEASELAKSLVLTGNYAGTSGGQFAGMARDISSSSNVTIGSARELLAATVATGSFGAQSIGTVTAAMARLQAMSGATTADVVGDFASMSRNVTAWAVEHNRQYSFLTKATYDQIKALQEHGKVEEAMVLTAGKLDKALADRQPALGTLQKLWKSLGEEASTTWDRMMGVGRDLAVEDKLAQVRVQIAANARRTDRADSVGPSGMRKGADKRDEELRQEEAELVQQIYQRNEMLSANAAAAAKDRQKIDDDASGRADALASASVDHKLAIERNKTAAVLAEQRNKTAAVLAGLELEQQATEAARQLGMSTAQQYADAKIALIKRETDTKIGLIKSETAAKAAEINEEIALERKRPAAGLAGEEAQAAKITAKQGERAAALADGQSKLAAALADGQKRIADVRAGNEAAEVQQSQVKAQAWAAAWLRAQDQVKAAQANTAELRINLIQDPQAQDQARTDRLIAENRKRLAASLRDLQQTGGPVPVDLVKSADDEMVALQDGLAERMKPGWQKQLDGWRDTNRLMRESHASMMDGVLKNAEDAWVQLATTGKLNVKTLVNSVLQEMARVQFRQFAAGLNGNLFGGLLSGLGGLLGFGASPAALLAGGTGFGDYNSSALLAGQRAAGGPVNAGSTYLVGERGPELLRMGALGGTVIPNHALGAGGGGTGASSGTTVAITLAPVIQIDARSDQAQIAQLVGGAMAQTQRDLWAQLRARGIA